MELTYQNYGGKLTQDDSECTEILYIEIFVQKFLFAKGISYVRKLIKTTYETY